MTGLCANIVNAPHIGTRNFTLKNILLGNGNYRNGMFLAPITENELENEIKSMDSSKSPGYDNISNKILKLTAKEISKPLTHIFNLTFQNGVIPEKLKLAIVTPIFKAGENNKYENYRPTVYQFSLVFLSYLRN
jgi:hypothetical protein